MSEDNTCSILKSLNLKSIGEIETIHDKFKIIRSLIHHETEVNTCSILRPLKLESIHELRTIHRLEYLRSKLKEKTRIVIYIKSVDEEDSEVKLDDEVKLDGKVKLDD